MWTKRSRCIAVLFSCLLISVVVPPTRSVAVSAASADALISAAAKGDNAHIRRLLHAGVPVDAQGAEGPALVYAAEYGHLATVKLLLTAGANLHACDKESVLFGGMYNRALWQAASEGHASIVRYLLSKGLNKDARDDNGYTPLLAAASGQHWQTARLLLEHGADPNLQTRHYQNSALILAARYGNKEIVHLLLRHGADVDLDDKESHTALWWAHYHRHTAVARMLRNVGAKK